MSHFPLFCLNVPQPTRIDIKNTCLVLHLITLHRVTEIFRESHNADCDETSLGNHKNIIEDIIERHKILWNGPRKQIYAKDAMDDPLNIL